jgi:hypothetical protein
MTQLETLVIHFQFAVLSDIIERPLTLMPIITPITLPKLRWFLFQGVDAYLEAIVCRMITPRLERLDIFFEQFTFSVPHLSQFMNTTENLRFGKAKLNFSSHQVDVKTYPHEEADLSPSLHIRVLCERLDLQVSAMARISNSLSHMFSAVKYLTLSYETFSQTSEEEDDVARIEWRKILRSFSNVKTLCVEDGLDEGIARCLLLDDEGLALGLLPELHELTYSRNSDTDNEIAPFINARQNAGRPITLVDL